MVRMSAPSGGFVEVDAAKVPTLVRAGFVEVKVEPKKAPAKKSASEKK